jgi:hypothetical protein
MDYKMFFPKNMPLYKVSDRYAEVKEQGKVDVASKIR